MNDLMTGAMPDQNPDNLRSHIREILLSDWDPDNASRLESARGAYDRYIEPLHEIMRSGGSEDQIVDYLFEREREFMCFPALGRQRLRRVARRLLALPLE